MEEQVPQQRQDPQEILDVAVQRAVHAMIPRIIEIVRLELAKPDKKYRKYLATMSRLEDAGPRERAKQQLMEELWSYYKNSPFTIKKVMELAPALVFQMTGIAEPSAAQVSLGMAFSYAAKTQSPIGETGLTITGTMGPAKTKVWNLSKKPAVKTL